MNLPIVFGGSRDVKLALVRELRVSQAGKCALCGEPLPPEDGRCVLEHSHVTGLLRGLVHTRCNRLIASYEERGYTNGLAEALAAYVGRNGVEVDPKRFCGLLAAARREAVNENRARTGYDLR